MADQNDNFLKDEYLKLQDQYEDYDRRALIIKGWIGAGAVAGFALGTNSDKHVTSITLFAIASIALCFWYLEAKWKTFQYAIADRIRIIEAHFRQESDVLIKEPKPLQIYHWWYKSYLNNEPIYEYENASRPLSKWRRLKNAAFQDFVHLPYSLIIGLCILIGLMDTTADKPTPPSCKPAVILTQPASGIPVSPTAYVCIWNK
ncbi:hypothetical protein AAHB66_00390 [Leclercia sp. S52]|uniref:hypothetical protein n=1 Tax=Leclercia sp. S52 TaxID=3138178 RepID=UPI00321C3979